MLEEKNSLLGAYLKDRRGCLDPVALGFAAGRRRTPGLRREEVAQRANISPTWYTWLEQGRGGAPSPDVLSRIAAGLMMTEPERVHLFMLAFGHPPEVRYKAPTEITPRLQRLLDAMETSPAIIKTATWDAVAWNQAAAVVLTDYGTLQPEDRNILKLIFCKSNIRAEQDGWGEMARFVVGSFRADATRAGAVSQVTQLVRELCQQSAEFAALWRDNDINVYSEGTKLLSHAKLGRLELEYSGFAVEGRSDLGMIVYNPVSPDDADRIRQLVRVRAVAAL